MTWLIESNATKATQLQKFNTARGEAARFPETFLGSANWWRSWWFNCEGSLSTVLSDGLYCCNFEVKSDKENFFKYIFGRYLGYAVDSIINYLHKLFQIIILCLVFPRRNSKKVPSTIECSVRPLLFCFHYVLEEVSMLLSPQNLEEPVDQVFSKF